MGVTHDGVIHQIVLPKASSSFLYRFYTLPNIQHYSSSPEESRQKINDFVAKVTNRKIKDLLPPDSITRASRLVLVNALHLQAHWLKPFTTLERSMTRKFLFTGLSGDQKDVEFMNPVNPRPYQYGTVQINGNKVSLMVCIT